MWQLRARDPFTADAILSNSPVWFILGGQEFESSEYLANNLFAGRLPLSLWKAGTERPTVVDQVKVVLKNHSNQHSETQTWTDAETLSRSTTWSTARSRADMSSRGASLATSDNTAFLSLPPDPLMGSAPTISQTASHSTSRASSSALSTAKSIAWSRQSEEAQTHSTSHGSSVAAGVSEGESEALASVFQDLPTQIYSLEEMRFLATAKVMNLQRREVLVRYEGQAPVLARTIDHQPAFRDAEYRDLMVARYRERVARADPAARPIADVDHEIATRLDRIIATADQPNIDFAEPEASPLIQSLERAQKTFQRSRSPSPDDEPPPRGARKLRIVAKGGDNT